MVWSSLKTERIWVSLRCSICFLPPFSPEIWEEEWFFFITPVETTTKTHSRKIKLNALISGIDSLICQQCYRKLLLHPNKHPYNFFYWKTRNFCLISYQGDYSCGGLTEEEDGFLRFTKHIHKATRKHRHTGPLHKRWRGRICRAPSDASAVPTISCLKPWENKNNYVNHWKQVPVQSYTWPQFQNQLFINTQ